MTAFRRVDKKGKVVYIEPKIDGIGRLPRMSTRQNNLQLGREMEGALKTLARTGWRDLVLELRAKKLNLYDIWHAHLAEDRETALTNLRNRHRDSPLEQECQAREKLEKDPRMVSGFQQLRLYSPKGARISWLLDPTHLTEIYERSELDGRAPNTVRRTLHRAVCDLLVRRYSRGRMLDVVAGAKVPWEDDERRFTLTPDEVTRALELAELDFRPLLALALTTGIDRGPLLAMRTRDYLPRVSQVNVPDTKNTARFRSILLGGSPVLENAIPWLDMLTHGSQPDDQLVRFSERQVRDRWEALRERLGRKELRWKDLRGVFATYFLLAGGQPAQLKAILGHKGMAMTMRYIQRLPAGNLDASEWRTVAGQVGRYRPQLVAVAGGAQ